MFQICAEGCTHNENIIAGHGFFEWIIFILMKYLSKKNVMEYCHYTTVIFVKRPIKFIIV